LPPDFLDLAWCSALGWPTSGDASRSLPELHLPEVENRLSDRRFHDGGSQPGGFEPRRHQVALQNVRVRLRHRGIELHKRIAGFYALAVVDVDGANDAVSNG